MRSADAALMERRRRRAESQRAYFERNRAEINARKVAALNANPAARERAREIARLWQAKNPDRARANSRIGSANRRARLRNDGGRLSADIVSRLMRKQRGLCVCCKADLKKAGVHVDHIVPVARGGENRDSNVQLLCPTCNVRKSDRDPVEFMQSWGFLL